MSTDLQDDPKKFKEIGFLEVLGIEPVDAGDGHAVIAIDPKPVHLNHNQTVNAAVLFGLGEVAGAGALVAGMMELAAKSYTVVKKATIEYLAPARGRVVATGRLDTEAFDAAKAKVAAGEAVEVDVPVEIVDSTGATAVQCVYTVVIKPRRPKA